MKNPPWRTGAGFSVKVLRFFALEHDDQKVAVVRIVHSRDCLPMEDRHKGRPIEFEDGLFGAELLVSNGLQPLRYYYRCGGSRRCQSHLRH